MADFVFVKSSYSGGDAGQECVRVARNIPGTVAVRDSKGVDGFLRAWSLRPPGRRSRCTWGSERAERFTDRRPARSPRADTRVVAGDVAAAAGAVGAGGSTSMPSSATARA